MAVKQAMITIKVVAVIIYKFFIPAQIDHNNVFNSWK